jgi:phosphatidylethanolamine-binding protein (PEBP) family uncharacterized protein
MRGDYYGYDGPCPPWNDEIIHHYVFTVYALDVEQLPLAGKFGGPEVRAAIAGTCAGRGEPDRHLHAQPECHTRP